MGDAFSVPFILSWLDMNTRITQAYHISRCSSWKLSSKARIAWDFIIILRIQQGEKQKRCHPKSDFRLWQAAHFSTKNSINKPAAMNNRRLDLDSSCISFCTSGGKRQLKTSWVDTKLCQLQLSISTSSKMLHKFCDLLVTTICKPAHQN